MSYISFNRFYRFLRMRSYSHEYLLRAACELVANGETLLDQCVSGLGQIILKGTPKALLATPSSTASALSRVDGGGRMPRPRSQAPALDGYSNAQFELYPTHIKGILYI